MHLISPIRLTKALVSNPACLYLMQKKMGKGGYVSTGGFGGKTGGLHSSIRVKNGVLHKAVVKRLLENRGLWLEECSGV